MFSFFFFLVEGDLPSKEVREDRDFPWWRFGEEVEGGGSLRARLSGIIACKEPGKLNKVWGGS
jgi:hypothetical protein